MAHRPREGLASRDGRGRRAAVEELGRRVRQAIPQRLGERPRRLEAARPRLLTREQLLPCGVPGRFRLAPQPAVQMLDEAHRVVEARRRALHAVGAVLVLDGARQIHLRRAREVVRGHLHVERRLIGCRAGQRAGCRAREVGRRRASIPSRGRDCSPSSAPYLKAWSTRKWVICSPKGFTRTKALGTASRSRKSTWRT